MILLASASPRAKTYARAIEQTLHTNTLLCPDISEACTRSRSGEFHIIVLDQAGSHAGPAEAAAISRNAGAAVVVCVNSALMSDERIADEIRGTQLRLEYERRIAIREATARVHNEVKNEITGVLLAAGLALSDPGLTPFAAGKIREIQQLANRMRNHFDISQ